MMHSYSPECFGSALAMVRVAISLEKLMATPSWLDSVKGFPLWVNVRSDLDPSTNWMSIRILSFFVTCMVLDEVMLELFCSTIELDDFCCCDIVEDCIMVEDELFCSEECISTTVFFSMMVRLVLDFVAPAGFSRIHVKIPESSRHVLLMIRVDALSSDSSIVISSPLLSGNVYLIHLTTGLGLASNSTLKIAFWFSSTHTGSNGLVKMGAMKLFYRKKSKVSKLKTSMPDVFLQISFFALSWLMTLTWLFLSWPFFAIPEPQRSNLMSSSLSFLENVDAFQWLVSEWMTSFAPFESYSVVIFSQIWWWIPHRMLLKNKKWRLGFEQQQIKDRIENHPIKQHECWIKIYVSLQSLDAFFMKHWKRCTC